MGRNACTSFFARCRTIQEYSFAEMMGANRENHCLLWGWKIQTQKITTLTLEPVIGLEVANVGILRNG